MAFICPRRRSSNERNLNPTAGIMMEHGIPAEVQCPICQDIFLDPSTLPCGHTFCLGCLRNTYAHSTRSGIAPVCATCRALLPKRRARSSINYQFRDLLQRCYSEAERARRAETQPPVTPPPPAEIAGGCPASGQALGKPYMPRGVATSNGRAAVYEGTFLQAAPVATDNA